MRRIICIILVSLIFTGCAKRMVQLSTPCSGKTTAEIVNTLAALVASEGFQVTVVNDKIGVLQAATAESHDIWTGMNTTRHWTFTVKGDTVLASAKTINYTKNVFGATTGSSEVYYDDQAHTDWQWYWNVRNGLATLCNAQIMFIESKKY